MKRGTLNTLSSGLTALKETLAVAESVTAGLVTTTLSRLDNATSFLQGGIIVYNLGQKARHLAVDPIYAQTTNCVSPEVAIQMAAEVTHTFCSHWGIAITGYAAPVPALKIRNCFAFYAIAHKGEIVLSSRIDTSLVGQARVQQYFVDHVLEAFTGLL